MILSDKTDYGSLFRSMRVADYGGDNTARQNIFDNETFFTEYQKLRECEVNANSPGIDISEKMLSVAQSENADPKITYIKMPMEDLGRLEGEFDVVISSMAFHYVEEYHRMFSTIVNTLVDNGLYILKGVEPYPTEELVQKHPEYYDFFHQPDFLFIKAVKHAAM